ncbi:hypothetical protein Q9966_008861 [Columba livia]|nr:hypothetical protein Q9966_008861 [Columba livia]
MKSHVNSGVGNILKFFTRKSSRGIQELVLKYQRLDADRRHTHHLHPTQVQMRQLAQSRPMAPEIKGGIPAVRTSLDHGQTSVHALSKESIDVNECTTENGGCHDQCCNTIGSYHCKCPAGQKLGEDGKSCGVTTIFASSDIEGRGDQVWSSQGALHCSSYLLNSPLTQVMDIHQLCA